MARIAKTTLSLALTAALGGGALAFPAMLAASLPASPAYADATDDAIADIDGALKANDDNKAIAKVNELGTAATLDPRITVKFLELAKSSKFDDVAEETH